MTSGYVPPPGSIPTLPVPDLAGLRRVHLIGIGGAGMSGIARLLIARGVVVSGSDLKDTRGLSDLRVVGARVYVGHRASQLADAEGGLPDAVVISSAIPPGNPELAEAHAGGVRVLARAQMLAGLAAGKRTLAVSGTHGKTTTTSMLAVILERMGYDPTYVIGGDLNEVGSGARHGEGDVFVAEADESDGSFLLLEPEVGIVTNVEEEHLDFYTGGRGEIEAAFGRFAQIAEQVVACGDDPGVRAALGVAGCDAVTYGLGPENAAHVSMIEVGDSTVSGTLELSGEKLALRIGVLPAHNLLNAAAAVVAATLVGVPAPEAAVAVAGFSGVRRRFEHLGSARGAEFYDDYAHHPTEVEATLGAAGRDGSRRVVAVFQPHRYSRTRALWREMGEALLPADLVIVTDVYPAGEEPIPGVSGKLLVDAFAAAAPGKRLLYLPRMKDIVQFLVTEVREGDVVLTIGAGDVAMVAEETLERIREAS